MRAGTRKPVLRTDYQAPPFRIERISLWFDLAVESTEVEAQLDVRRAPQAQGVPLRLDGERLQLQSVSLNGRELRAGEFQVDESGLTLNAGQAASFVLTLRTRLQPHANSELLGLYESAGTLLTQCEAQGFRRITYFTDRPDVLARYTVCLRADRNRFPVLLSNGNLVKQGDLPDGRHFAIWDDPHPKPSYLFALVAGRLQSRESQVTTRSGRGVRLQLWADAADVARLEHAQHSLERAIAWDEARFGLELDLQRYMIVAVRDFNLGAMENKGLNLFSTRYVLADPTIATDVDYAEIEAVVGHEYFHNWTGNRVTCRDWFQLTLKEGLTVFRDQQFSADMGSAPVCRIADIRALRASQFPEDAGPLAHPVQPQRYLRIDNFYTATVYNKGAELIRMMHTLLGREGFRRGMDLYISRHDNSAATIPDFVAAMQDASGVDLGDFARWYHQAGTPEITIEDRYDPDSKSYELTVSQMTPPTPGQLEKQIVPIPIAMGLLGPNGDELPTRLTDEDAAHSGTRLLVNDQIRQTFRFVDVPARPTPSLLRGFSAPVKLQGVPLDRLKFLAIHDTDPVARWDAGQRAAIAVLLDRVALGQAGTPLPPLDADLIAAMRHTLADAVRDPAFAAEALALPSEATLADEMEVVDVEAIHAVREEARAAIAAALATALGETYRTLTDPGPYKTDGESIGRRALRNACLAYLAAGNPEGGARLAKAQFDAQQNMTDVLAALAVLTDIDCPERPAALGAFYERWQDDMLVVDKWFALQARSSLPGTIDALKALTQHPAFSRSNPNRLRALVGTFSQANPLHFHNASGSGYAFLAGEVLTLDPDNPQVAARMVQALGNWRRYDASRQALMKAQLQRIHDTPGLSTNTFEMVSKSLADA